MKIIAERMIDGELLQLIFDDGMYIILIDGVEMARHRDRKVAVDITNGYYRFLQGIFDE